MHAAFGQPRHLIDRVSGPRDRILMHLSLDAAASSLNLCDSSRTGQGCDCHGLAPDQHYENISVAKRADVAMHCQIIPVLVELCILSLNQDASYVQMQVTITHSCHEPVMGTMNLSVALPSQVPVRPLQQCGHLSHYGGCSAIHQAATEHASQSAVQRCLPVKDIALCMDHDVHMAPLKYLHLHTPNAGEMHAAGCRSP